MLSLNVICALSVSLLFTAPVIATVLTRRCTYPSVIRFSFALILQQLLFALCAGTFGGYGRSIIVAALAVVTISIVVSRREGEPAPRWSGLISWMIFAATFVVFILIRRHYSYLNFNNNGDEVGIEKLFNLSLQQSFLYGESYPPEWIWLAGEPIRYYVFLKSIPGLVAWIARSVFDTPAAGGVCFIVFESFFTALVPALVCAWVVCFGRAAKCKSSVLALGALAALFCLVGTHLQAFLLGLRALASNATLDWWRLSHQVIPFTDNQYLAWFMLVGDGHAYMQVHFLQILLLGAACGLLGRERISPLGASAVGVLCAALVLSHPGSVLVTATVGAVFGALIILSGYLTKCGRDVIALVANGSIALLVAAPFLLVLFESSGIIKTVPVTAAMASQVLPFAKLQFPVLVWVTVLFVVRDSSGVLGMQVMRALASRRLFSGMVFVGVCMLCAIGRPALALTVVLAAFVYVAAQVAKGPQLRNLFAASAFGVWLLPELVAFDHVLDTRTDWIRFQMALRFWPEGYVLLPFVCTISLIDWIGQQRLSRAWVSGVVSVLGLFTVSHIPGFSNRLSRVVQEPSLDGFQEFGRRYPNDVQIVNFLRSVSADERVVIGESCGLGDSRVPVHFGWSGRIAAFSGRSGVCGWVRHAMLYNNPLRQPGFEGASVEERTTTFLRCYSGLFSHILSGDLNQARVDLMGLKALGVTHIVYGDFERKNFPGFSLDMATAALQLEQVFRASDGMGVLKLGQ